MHRAVRDNAGSARCQALEAEGVSICHWQRQIMPARDFFQREEGYASTSAWRCCGSSVSYDPDDYPISQAFAASHAYLRGIYPPNDMELMGRYVAAIGKVLGQA